jgi:hypothetical protein
VSGYGLDNRAIEVRSPSEVKGFLLCPLCTVLILPSVPLADKHLVTLYKVCPVRHGIKENLKNRLPITGLDFKSHFYKLMLFGFISISFLMGFRFLNAIIINLSLQWPLYHTYVLLV